MTPLHAAAERGHIEVVRLLLPLPYPTLTLTLTLLPGFLNKHRDTLSPDVEAVMRQSQAPLVKSIFKGSLGAQLLGGDRTRSARVSPPLGTQFRQSLRELLGVVNATGVHYIRCMCVRVCVCEGVCL